MAHPEQQEFFKRMDLIFSNSFKNASRILEVGSQDINGTVRTLFPNSSEYLGIDLGEAKCVDWVIPGELIELPDQWADITISTECFEHCIDWNRVFLNMIRITRPSGLVIITCAGIGRPTHGTIDSDTYSSPFTTSYYKNLSTDEIAEKIQLGAYFDRHGFELNSSSKDLYFWGVRSNTEIKQLDNYWQDPLERLSRAQGQLGQAAARHSMLQAKFDKLEMEYLRAIGEMNNALAEANQARETSTEVIDKYIAIDKELKLLSKDLTNTTNENLALKQVLKQIYSSRSWKITLPFRLFMNYLRKIWKSKD